MNRNTVQDMMKQQVKNYLVYFLKGEAARKIRNQESHDYKDLRKEIDFYSDKYSENMKSESQENIRPDPVFISGRFRSGSTLLWNIFRNMQDYTAYYEPFNERRWFDVHKRGTVVDKSHRGVEQYWKEYNGLSRLCNYYSEDWVRHRLLMRKSDFNFAMKNYIAEIIKYRSDCAVLQFNRVDFRLAWLKQNFPGAKIVHIYRNPRDQWCSLLYGQQDYGPEKLNGTGFEDHFYLKVWYNDLLKNFPFLAGYEEKHRYYIFFLLWKLSYCFGQHYSTVSISLEELSDQPYDCLGKVFKAINKGQDFNGIDLSFVEPQGSVWERYAKSDWFEEIESECNQVIQDFFLFDEGG